MPAPQRRTGARPAVTDLENLDRPAKRLTKAAETDPVLGIGAGANRPVTTPAAPSGKPTPTPSAKIKTGFYQDREAADRARAAWAWTRGHEGHRSFSDFIAHAVAVEVARLEKKHNDGDPWPGMAAGEIGTGKPLGS